jgi:superfamily II DNA or RNA helicase
MTLKLRSYQVQAITAIKAREEPGARVPLVLATGLGKTVIFTSYVTDWLDRNAGRRALILVHTDELAEQALAKMRQVAPHRRAGMVKAGRNDVHAEIIVSSRQTLGSARRREQIKRVGLIVIDEMHHCVRNNTYGRILEHFGVFDDTNPDQLSPFVLGVTATLARGDKAKLSTVWSEPAFTRDILYGIRHGYLLDVRGERVIVPDLDLSRVRVRAGDYNENDIADELDRTFAPEVIAQKYADVAAGRRGIAFWPLVDTAYHGEKAFLAAGIRSGTVHGSLPKPERRELLQRFRLPLEHSEAIDVMHNAMVLCLDEKTEILTDEGWVGPDAMTLEHRVANWDQGKVHFVEPREVVVRPRGPEESMYFLETPRRSIRVTGRHRMLYRTSRTGP